METITDLALAQRIGKLPFWAQDVIYGLDRELAEARREIAKLSEGPAGSNVRVDTHGVNPDRLLGRNIPVSFDLAGGTVVVRHAEYDHGDGLHVHVTGSHPGGYPHILPSVSNAFEIKLGER